jgi:hypothetical protein
VNEEKPGKRIKEHLKIVEDHIRAVDKRGKHSKQAKELEEKVKISASSVRRWLGKPRG